MIDCNWGHYDYRWKVLRWVDRFWSRGLVAGLSVGCLVRVGKTWLEGREVGVKREVLL